MQRVRVRGKSPYQKYSETAIIYEVVQYINGFQRPKVKTADEWGRIRIMESYVMQSVST